MFDFFKISVRSKKRGVVEIYPRFLITKSQDLMIRGGDFYAIWVEERNLWSTDEQDAVDLIDRELDKYAKGHSGDYVDSEIKVLHMKDAETGVIDSWHKYCQRQLRDNYHALDECLIFANTETVKSDYASKKLPYPLEDCDTPAWDELMDVLYSEPERKKIEWAIGSIVHGDSRHIQKFVVLYGAAGTGKSTVLNIIQMLFDGYYATFSAKALGSANDSFALESFKTNPLVAIEHDGDLSRIEDNTRINSLTSHEMMTVNEKHKSLYSNKFKSFLFMGTNKPVRITDAKSGLIRRLIDVTPSGKKIPKNRYLELMSMIKFELGGIATHCLKVYENNVRIYDDYIPLAMLGATNDFYNFVLDSYSVFKKENNVTLKSAWEMYKTYCDDAKITYPYSQRIFKEELKNYFREYKDRFVLEDDTRVRSYYIGFKSERFEEAPAAPAPEPTFIEFALQLSLLDAELASYPAQYASGDIPKRAWDKVTTTLADINTSLLHYVKPPENMIVIDFDLKDENGEKNYQKNLEAASKWPPTYAELSKSEKGIHLHYYYTGDISKLAVVYDDGIEIKTFSGKSSLRRKLTKCNNLPIAKISSGLPLKGEKKVVNIEAVRSEMGLRNLIKRNLNKEIHPYTKPSIDFIFKILEEAYASGMPYDVSDLKGAVFAFAANSSHNQEYCINKVGEMEFKSYKPADEVAFTDEKPIIFYDVEVFPNLCLVCYKKQGENNPVVRMFNPTPKEIESLLQARLIDFNGRRYDRHILYAILIGYDNEQIYNLSQQIIKTGTGFFREAYGLGYTDVYDFADSTHKQSLKKFEIEMNIHHKELGFSWDEPVDESLWDLVADYCENDVRATEATFEYLKDDWDARQMLAKISGLSVNNTTNDLTTKFIFGKDREPQKQFNYRDLGDTSKIVERTIFVCGDLMDEYTVFDEKMRPIFPSYKKENGVSTYRGEKVSEGGYAYSEKGCYQNVALLDVSSMHPSSTIAEELFGPVYTQRYKEIVQARLAIKHGEIDKAKTLLNGALAEYLTDVTSASGVARALKTAINSVYGLTAAKFPNAFRDPRNVDNIVAKRGALFMINLKHEVQKRGFIVAHIKTDSIKIPDATPEIINFVMEYGKLYGYSFEHEATYERMCIVDKATYIARYSTKEACQQRYGYIPGDNNKHSGQWTATAKKFQRPYVFKKLFTKEPIIFKDLCEVRSVTMQPAIWLDYNEELISRFLDKVKEVKKLKYPEEMYYRDFECVEKELRLYNAQADTPIDEKDLHKRVFVGKVGEFCPMKIGIGAGLLVAEGKDPFSGDVSFGSVNDTKGFRWLESESVVNLKAEDMIDRSYFDKLVDDAKESMMVYCDYDWFVSDDPYVPPKYVDGRPVYPDGIPYEQVVK